MVEMSKQIEFLQDQLSMPAAMALNYCCTAVCVRDYIKQGLNISCLDYRCSFLFSTVCILLITRKDRTDNPSSLQLVLATDLKLETFRDLVARPEEAWASLASYCGLDPNNVKPLEAHKKWALLQNFQGSLPMIMSTISWMRFQILILENETILLQGFSARCFPQPRGSSTRGQGGPGVAARSWQVGFFSFQR